jgi:hypothetical protein
MACAGDPSCSQLASCAHLHIKLPSYMYLEFPLCVHGWLVLRCVSELVDETLATPYTHCQ